MTARTLVSLSSFTIALMFLASPVMAGDVYTVEYQVTNNTFELDGMQSIDFLVDVTIPEAVSVKNWMIEINSEKGNEVDVFLNSTFCGTVNTSLNGLEFVSCSHAASVDLLSGVVNVTIDNNEPQDTFITAKQSITYESGLVDRLERRDMSVALWGLVFLLAVTSLLGGIRREAFVWTFISGILFTSTMLYGMTVPFQTNSAGAVVADPGNFVMAGISLIGLLVALVFIVKQGVEFHNHFRKKATSF